ncbi:ribosomal protein l7ae prokaryotes [Lucifera butyrica]|uniref:Ribosomal protein l7ae prokaryotes n=1 Tax=Lucifera butyrica TaxID=1351585 RepID=A0A498R814_9FIRM|nr:ribosomal L7Ae/L30e/S12e/Gadd45 family protein [Lucifera butyrica]VBB08856.1 ribosomal protein l7ae prokaryotes [Lucifera butyrica]
MPLTALKTAKKVIGVKQTLKAVEKEQVALVYMAADADARIIASLKELCCRRGVGVEYVPTMVELGKACGIEVGAAAVGLFK